jgi:hypothetical protein
LFSIPFLFSVRSLRLLFLFSHFFTHVWYVGCKESVVSPGCHVRDFYVSFMCFFFPDD